MLASVHKRLRARIPLDAYPGLSAALLPVDATLSLLAKRSYPLYRLWHAWNEATSPLLARPERPRLPAHPEHLATLRRNGCVSFPGPFDAAALGQAGDFLRDCQRRAVALVARQDPAGRADQVRFTLDHDGLGIHLAGELYRPTGRYRFYFDGTVLEQPGLPPLIADFAHLAAPLGLAQTYYGTTAIQTPIPYLMGEVLVPAPAFESWHIDCVRPTLTAMLYLTDVAPVHGPVRYLPGSHVLDAERHRQSFAVCQSGLERAYFTAARNTHYDQVGQSLPGQAGTMLVFDVRGIHAGSRCQTGERIVLVTGYRPPAAQRLSPRLFRDPHPAHAWFNENVAA